MPRKPVARDRAEPGSPDSRAMTACDGDGTALGDGVSAVRGPAVDVRVSAAQAAAVSVDPLRSPAAEGLDRRDRDARYD